MNSLTIHNHQKKAHGRAGESPICGGMGHRAPTFNGRKSTPEHLPSLLASGRSLRGGCAARRQTGAQAGGDAGMNISAIRPTRLNDIADLRRVALSGADACAASVNLQCTHQPAVRRWWRDV